MTAKSFYALLIRLHPTEFRETYGEEMLWVFEQDSAERSPYWLIWDGARSLVRQRLLRPDVAAATATATVDGPSFLVLEETRLRPMQVLRGAAAAAVLFGLVLGPAVDTGHVSGSLRIPTIYTYQKSGPGAYQIEEQRLREAESRSMGTAYSEAAAGLDTAGEGGGSNGAEPGADATGNPTVYRIPAGVAPGFVVDERLLGLLDLNGDGWIDLDEQRADAARRYAPLFRMVPADEQGRVALEDLRALLPVLITR